MTQTDIDVCNLAINRISGGAAIEALNEDSPMAEHCLVAYPHVRRLLMGKHRWVFAGRIAQLARLADAPAGNPLTYAFSPPGDLIGAVHAFRDGPRADAGRVSMIPMGGYLASDSATVWVEYTALVSEAFWPVWFVELVRVALAAELASLVQNHGLAASLRAEAFGTPQENGEGGLYATAKVEDARNAPSRDLRHADDPGPLVSARFSNPWPGGFGWNGQIVEG